MLLQRLDPSTAGRLRSSLLSAALAALLILLAAACGEGAGRQPAAAGDAVPNPSPEQQAGLQQPITVYSSPTCGCCQQYEGYLEANGFQVTSIRTENLTEIKDGLGVPPDMRSCHTAIVDEYFVEGHVPVEAIRKLLDEQPEIDGVALPGMPLGSPGMGGAKAQPFTVYSITAGRVDEFMTL